MGSEPVADETLILTTKDGRRVTVSSRMLFQRTSRNNTTESYSYDAAGNLTAAEADIRTWEERNTEIYRWLNDQTPPFDVQRKPPPPLGPARSRGTSAVDDSGLVRMASSVHRVPPLSWSGTTASGRPGSSKDDVEDSRRELTATVDGRQRSQSEHFVTMRTNVQQNSGASKPAGAKFQPAKVGTPARRGGHIWSPPQSRTQPSSAAAGHKSVIHNGPVPARAWSTPAGAQRHASLAERHSRRCMENRRRKVTAYRQGVDY